MPPVLVSLLPSLLLAAVHQVPQPPRRVRAPTMPGAGFVPIHLVPEFIPLFGPADPPLRAHGVPAAVPVAQQMDLAAKKQLGWTLEKLAGAEVQQSDEAPDVPILPRELYSYIAGFMDGLSLLNFTSSCRHFLEIVHEENAGLANIISSQNDRADIILFSELKLTDWMCYQLKPALRKWEMFHPEQYKSRDFSVKLIRSLLSRIPEVWVEVPYSRNMPDSRVLTWLHKALNKVELPFVKTLIPEAMVDDLWIAIVGDSDSFTVTTNCIFWIPPTDMELGELLDHISLEDAVVLCSQKRYRFLLLPYIEANYLIPWWKGEKPMEGQEFLKASFFIETLHNATGFLDHVISTIQSIWKEHEYSRDRFNNHMRQFNLFLAKLKLNYCNSPKFTNESVRVFRGALWGLESRPVSMGPLMVSAFAIELKNNPEIVPTGPATPLKIVERMSIAGTKPFHFLVPKNNIQVPAVEEVVEIKDNVKEELPRPEVTEVVEEGEAPSGIKRRLNSPDNGEHTCKRVRKSEQY